MNRNMNSTLKRITVRGLIVAASIISLAMQPFTASAAALTSLERPAFAANTIQVTDLGVLPSGTYSSARDINNLGQAVGLSTDIAFEYQTVIWSGGNLTLIDKCCTGGLPRLEAINDSREAVGWENGGYVTNGIFWDSTGKAWVLPALPGGENRVIAYDINNSGLIVGQSRDVSGLDRHAVVWDRTTLIHDLGLGTARGINDLGDIVGMLGSNSHAFLWRNGSFTDLGLGLALDINNNGLIAGWTSGQVPVVWRNGVMENLPGISGETIGYGHIVTDLNNNGDVVGYAPSPVGIGFHYTAVLWRGGTAINLGFFPGGTSSIAYGINDSGQIVGEGSIVPDGPMHALLWTVGDVVLPPAPLAFNKSAPNDGVANVSLSPTLLWDTSSNATSYEYCYDTTNDNACSSWINNGASTSKALSGLSINTTYYWQARANNMGGTTYANNGAGWSFTTVSDVTLPTVLSITRLDTNPSSAASIQFNVLFSEPVTGMDMAGSIFDDLTLTTSSGISSASVTSVSGSGSTYMVTVDTGSGNGTIRLNVGTAGSIVDLINNPLAVGFTSGEIYTLIKSVTFTDVPLTHWANGYIDRLYNAGITGGCATLPLTYCPANSVTRAQMAIFLLRGMHGSTYTPPAATGTKFADVPLGSFGAAWIEQLAAEGITSGCGSGNYCPSTPVTRAQMAIFLVRAKHGVAFIPPTATGIFADVPIGSFGANFIEQLVTDAITSGCGIGTFCPNTTVKRDSMAVFLVKTFGLP